MTFARFASVAALCFSSLTAGCGVSVYRPPGAATLDLAPEAEINDDDVRKAYDARPQMKPGVRVAYFSLDADKSEDVEAMLKGLPGVAGAYRIPALLATGERRFSSDERYHGAPQPKPISIKKLRVLAAKAHADVLLIVDRGHKVDVGVNGWIATSVLLLPLLFVPFQNTTTSSYADMYLIDVRNGYTYGELSGEAEEQSGAHTIYAQPSAEASARHWKSLLGQARGKLEALIKAEQARPPSDRPSPPASAPVPSSDKAAAPAGG